MHGRMHKDIASNVIIIPQASVYVFNESLPSIPCTILNDNNIQEPIWCLVQLDDNNTLLVGVLYRSPHSSTDNNILLNTAIQSVHQIQRFTHLLLIGDFNCPEIN